VYCSACDVIYLCCKCELYVWFFGTPCPFQEFKIKIILFNIEYFLYPFKIFTKLPVKQDLHYMALPSSIMLVWADTPCYSAVMASTLMWGRYHAAPYLLPSRLTGAADDHIL
jgi:hypothetical protein